MEQSSPKHKTSTVAEFLRQLDADRRYAARRLEAAVTREFGLGHALSIRLAEMDYEAAIALGERTSMSTLRRDLESWLAPGAKDSTPLWTAAAEMDPDSLRIITRQIERRWQAFVEGKDLKGVVRHVYLGTYASEQEARQAGGCAIETVRRERCAAAKAQDDSGPTPGN